MSPHHESPFARAGGTREIFVWTYNGRAAILAVRGEIDLYNQPHFSAELNKTQDASVIVIDLTQCRYLDGSALHALERARKALAIPLHIVIDDRSQLRRLFEITQLHRKLRIFSTVRAALADMLFKETR